MRDRGTFYAVDFTANGDLKKRRIPNGNPVVLQGQDNRLYAAVFRFNYALIGYMAAATPWLINGAVTRNSTCNAHIWNNIRTLGIREAGVSDGNCVLFAFNHDCVPADRNRNHRLQGVQDQTHNVWICLTHEQAIFVKRVSQFRRAVSPVILGRDAADDNTLSMRVSAGLEEFGMSPEEPPKKPKQHTTAVITQSSGKPKLYGTT